MLHNIPDPNRAQVKSCTVRIYEDSLGLKLEEFNVNQPLSPQGTEILLSKVQKMQSLRFIFNMSDRWNLSLECCYLLEKLK
ncbi:MAG: hypothetical protein IPI30_14195 [Saprospiraceae bacterium]|nr:hypothetical protein [Candidatus Vicinibacter affinis]